MKIRILAVLGVLAGFAACAILPLTLWKRFDVEPMGCIILFIFQVGAVAIISAIVNFHLEAQKGGT